MPKPLGPEADDGLPIHEQIAQQTAKAHRERMAAIGLTFSTKGYERALSQTVAGMNPWSQKDERYLGFPFEVVPGQREQVLLVLVPGNSPEAKAHREATRADRPRAHEAQTSKAVQVRVERLGDKPTLELVAEGLTKPQLCDVLTHWCTANRNDPMVPGLTALIREHGRFE